MQLLQAMRVRHAPKRCKNSSKFARSAAKNHAHFRRATHRTITKIAMLAACSRRGPSVDLAHVLQSSRVRVASILHESRCNFARFSPKNKEKVRVIRRGTSDKRAAQAQKQCLDLYCATQSNADAFAQILQAMHMRCAQKICKNSSKFARSAAKNHAHFRRATHRTITKIAMLAACRRRGPSVDLAHVLQSSRVRVASILRASRCTFARFSPKKSEKFRANRRGTSAERASQAQKQCFDVPGSSQSNADALEQLL